MSRRTFLGQGPTGEAALKDATERAHQHGYFDVQEIKSARLLCTDGACLAAVSSADSAESSHTPITRALGVADPEKFYQDFEISYSHYAAPEHVQPALVLLGRSTVMDGLGGWKQVRQLAPLNELDVFIRQLHEVVGEAIKASEDPEIHAAGDLIVDQIRAMGKKLKAYREQASNPAAQLEHVADRAPREILEAVGWAIHATAAAMLSRTPGDPGLTAAVDRLERVLKEVGS